MSTWDDFQKVQERRIYLQRELVTLTALLQEMEVARAEILLELKPLNAQYVKMLEEELE
jgi:hypothetical protein